MEGEGMLSRGDFIAELRHLRSDISLLKTEFQERFRRLQADQAEARRATQASADRTQRKWLQLHAEFKQLCSDVSSCEMDWHSSRGLAAVCIAQSNSRPPPGFGLQSRLPVSPPPGFGGLSDSSALVLDGDHSIPPPPGFGVVSRPVSATLEGESPSACTSVQDLSTEDSVCSFAIQEGEEELDSDLPRWMTDLDVDCTSLVMDNAAQAAPGGSAAPPPPMHPPEANASAEDVATVTAVPLVAASGSPGGRSTTSVPATSAPSAESGRLLVEGVMSDVSFTKHLSNPDGGISFTQRPFDPGGAISCTRRTAPIGFDHEF
jgi:hypothetical protein